MATSITIRNVPEEVRDERAERGARRGMSLQAYILGEFTRMAAEVDKQLLLDRIQARQERYPTRISAEEIVRAIHEGRP
ncbi:MAG: hypothetical protein KDB69_09185 [Acidimicrobiia bacterium]|nr:hypothetical protein [Acidimicrobiia bacterium]